MGKMKDVLIGEIERLSKETGYSFEFLMDTWFQVDTDMDWPDFVDATLDREWIEAPADALWMITVSPDCKKPVVRCAELEKPYPFAVTIMNKDFTGLPGLVADALQQLDALRRPAKRTAV